MRKRIISIVVVCILAVALMIPAFAVDEFTALGSRTISTEEDIVPRVVVDDAGDTDDSDDSIVPRVTVKDSTSEDIVPRVNVSDAEDSDESDISELNIGVTLATEGEASISDYPEEETGSIQTFSIMSGSQNTEKVSKVVSALPQNLTGVWADDVVTIAESQLGYQEESDGYTVYGDWWGYPRESWCAMFASFCLYYAGVPESVFPENALCSEWIEKLDEMNLYKKASSGYTPVKGDLIFFKNSSSTSSTDHVGIVTGVTEENSSTIIHTIEGNTSNSVAEREYDINISNIVGYGVLPENTDDYIFTLKEAGSMPVEDATQEVANRIYSVLKYIGWSDMEIAGAFGNLTQEHSTFDFSTVETVTDSSEDFKWGPQKQAWDAKDYVVSQDPVTGLYYRRGIGIIGWTDNTDGATGNTRLREYAAANNVEWYETLELQLQFLTDVENGDTKKAKAILAGGSYSNSDYGSFNTSTIEGAMQWWLCYVEGLGQSYWNTDNCKYNARLQFAKEWMNKISTLTYDPDYAAKVLAENAINASVSDESQVSTDSASEDSSIVIPDVSSSSITEISTATNLVAPTVKKDSDGKWYYYNANGKKDLTYTGFAKNDNGKWYVESGVVKFDKNSVLKDSTGAIGDKGTWYYVVGSKVQTDYTGVANYKNENGWWYIQNGKVNFNANTVAKNDNGWWYVKDGKVDFSYTGFAENSNGKWYCEGGKVTFNKNSVIKDTNGAIGTKGDWWYVVGSKVQTTFTGLADYKNDNGWWYIKSGKVDFNVKTVAKNKNGRWKVTGGKVDFSFTGIAGDFDYKYWYCKNGKVDTSYSTAKTTITSGDKDMIGWVFSVKNGVATRIS